MKKRFILASLFLVLMSLLSAQKAGEESSERFISPTIGFGAPGVSTGVDFMYRHKSGFVAICNLNVSIPISPLAGFIIHPEFYAGYSLKRNNFYASFSGGLWAGGGMSFYDYRLVKNEKGDRNLEPEWDIAVIATFGIRNDYMYFFDDKMGITFSHTHGLGIHAGRWFLEDTFSFYTMMLKLGVTFRV